MKILIIIDSLGSGGAERSTEVLCDYLAKHQIYFHILALDKKEVGVQERMFKKGYHITFIKKNGFAREVRQITQLIKTENFDLVHSILFRANIRTRCSKLFCNFVHLESLVNTTYSHERELDKQVNQKALKIFKFLDKISAPRWVDHFHSITKTVKEHYEKELGLNAKKITVIYRGRKPIISSIKQKHQGINNKINFINVGRQEFQKGQIYLLEAAKILIDLKYNFHLKIYGREGTVTPDLEAFIGKYNLEDYVSLEGYSKNISDHLLEADVFIFPSLYEGLGGALIEAQAAGLPVACNNIPVLHEVVIEDQNAKFFNVHNVHSIAEALKFFLDNPDKRRSFGKKSLENFQDKFQEDKNHVKLLELYKQLVKN